MEVHRVPWQRGTRLYGNIAKGGEEETTIKYDTHQRSGHNIQTLVSFTAETDLSGKKDEILARDTTKQ